MSPPPASAEPLPSSKRVPVASPPRPLASGIALRLTLAIMVMAVTPLVIGISLAARLAWKAADVFYDPRVGRELEASLDLYGALVRALKSDMKHRAAAIAASEPLRASAHLKDAVEVQSELKSALGLYADAADAKTGQPALVDVVALEVWTGLSIDECLDRFVVGGAPDPASKAARLSEARRPSPVDLKKEHVLVQCRPLGPDEAAPMLVATFATEKARIEHRLELDEFLRTYKSVLARREEFVRLNVSFFALLLGGTILGAAVVGLVFSRGVSGRVSRVAEAARAVAGGDLAVRVPEQGDDEVGELAVAFNRMLQEVERSRARIEYLQRMGAWQDMARRLAHEIKNPLTPIQLAVEETHSKYKGDDERFRKLLDTTLEIVTEEVGTLRYLVSEFSDFARLPHARLAAGEIEQFLADVKPTLERLGLGTEETDVALRLTPSGGVAIPVRVSVETKCEGSEGPTPLLYDKHVLRKAVDNLVRNAVQAIRAAHRGYRVRVHATLIDRGRIALDVDDDGPGVPADARDRIFDPYFTTRTEGTGLGLAIVKKVLVEHGGVIECLASPMGGARFRLVFPPLDSAEARAAQEESERLAPPPSSM